MLRAVLIRSGLASKRYVQLGCGDLSAVPVATELGFRGLVVDSDASAVAAASRIGGDTVEGVTRAVASESVARLVEDHGFDGDIDLLSLGIADNAYWLWDALGACRPRVVTAVFNPVLGARRAVIVPEGARRAAEIGDDVRDCFGASLPALERVAQRTHHRLVAVAPGTAVAIFVREGLATALPARPADTFLPAAGTDDALRAGLRRGPPIVELPPAVEAVAQRRAEAPAPSLAERAAFFASAADQTSAIVADTRWGSFLVDTHDMTVARSLFVKGTRGEMHGLERILLVLEAEGLAGGIDGSTFVDVGANIGTTTIAALVAHPFGRAIAIEPAPDNQRLLRANIALNSLHEQVVVHAAAASDAEGELELVLNAKNSGGHAIASHGRKPTRPGAGGGHARVAVRAVTLDGLVARGELDPGAVGLLWMDVQGFEGHVLAGARSLTSRGIPILLEFHPAMLRATDGLERLLAAATSGYTTFVDSRQMAAGPAVVYDKRPVTELPALLDELAADRTSFTDLLFMRCE